MNFILDNVAIGEYEEAVTPERQITALLCVAEERNLSSPCLPYHKVPIIDMTPIPAEQLRDALDCLNSMLAQGHRVLVFCNQGIGRAPSVVIAHLCCEMGYTFGQAVEMVALKRPQISMLPNLIVTIKEARKLKDGNE